MVPHRHPDAGGVSLRDQVGIHDKFKQDRFEWFG